MAQSVGNVWTLSPTFRAERSDTPRHLSEFYMLEAEVAFTDKLEDVMNVAEGLVKRVTADIDESRIGKELLEALHSKTRYNVDDSMTVEVLEQRWKQLTTVPWPRIQFREAVELLQKATEQNEASFEFKPNHSSGLQAEHEKYLAAHVGNGSPVFVTDYPREIKAFYMAPSSGNTDGQPTVSCFDLIVPDICEIAGGSMREHRLPELLQSMARHGLLDTKLPMDDQVPEDLKWYVDLRRWGSVPHGGFGLGFDRLLCYLSGVSSVRDMVSFPRWHGRCDC
jgi:asparaginyl-tRNA synthetase